MRYAALALLALLSGCATSPVPELRRLRPPTFGMTLSGLAAAGARAAPLLFRACLVDEACRAGVGSRGTVHCLPGKALCFPDPSMANEMSRRLTAIRRRSAVRLACLRVMDRGRIYRGADRRARIDRCVANGGPDDTGDRP